MPCQQPRPPTFHEEGAGEGNGLTLAAAARALAAGQLTADTAKRTVASSHPSTDILQQLLLALDRLSPD